MTQGRPIERRPLRRALLATCAAAATSLTALLAAGPALAAYPERPITMIVPWGAGGGTDAVARFIASELEKDLKQPINVVNRTGGSGVVGHTAISSAPPDGYTIGLITVEIAMMKHVGLTTLGPDGFTAHRHGQLRPDRALRPRRLQDQGRQGTASRRPRPTPAS